MSNVFRSLKTFDIHAIYSKATGKQVSLAMEARQSAGGTLLRLSDSGSTESPGSPTGIRGCSRHQTDTVRGADWRVRAGTRIGL